MRQIKAQSNTVIMLGRQGENEAVEVLFDIAGYDELYGTGAFELLNLRPTETTPYTCSITVDDEYVHWVVQAADVALTGIGKCELTYVVDGTIAKSVTFSTRVLPSIEGAGEVPEPYESRIADLIAASANITVVSQQAVENVNEAKTAGITALQDEAQTQIQAVGNKGTEQVDAVGQAGAEQVQVVNTAGATQTANAKAQADAAAESARTATQKATAANNSALDAEAFAKGTRNGTPVTSGDAAFQNNAKYYAELINFATQADIMNALYGGN